MCRPAGEAVERTAGCAAAVGGASANAGSFMPRSVLGLTRPVVQVAWQLPAADPAQGGDSHVGSTPCHFRARCVFGGTAHGLARVQPSTGVHAASGAGGGGVQDAGQQNSCSPPECPRATGAAHEGGSTPGNAFVLKCRPSTARMRSAARGCRQAVTHSPARTAPASAGFGR